jgi:hypothetical protein
VRRLLLTAIALGLGAAAACSSFGGESSSGAADASADGVAPDDGAPTDSAAPPSGDGGLEAGTIADDDFDDRVDDCSPFHP